MTIVRPVFRQTLFSVRAGLGSLLVLLLLVVVGVAAPASAQLPSLAPVRAAAGLGHGPMVKRAAPVGVATLVAPSSVPTAPSHVESAAEAEAHPRFELGNCAWVLISSALVLLMTPGLAFFYGGLTRSKNVLNTLMMSMSAMGLLGVLWILCGYSFAFGGGNAAHQPFFGGFEYLFYNHVGLDTANPDYPKVPHMLFAIFQGMFFIITPALISGSLVERVKFKTFLIFMGFWSLLVYCPVAHWVWGGGWIGKLGVMDFAGGAVVHVNAGFAALAATLAVGPRKGYGKRHMPPHSLPLCLLGVGLLWFGWFGFNAGSAMGADALGILAFNNTQVAAASAMLVWMLIDLWTRKEITALGAGTGAVAGLVGITPACGFVSPMGAVLVGGLTSAVCYLSATLRGRSRLDDSLDAFAVHGVGGFTGAILTGVFATAALSRYNSGALSGLVEGGFGVFFNQVWTTCVVALYSFCMSYVIMKTVARFTNGARVSEEAEYRGLDLSEHGEEAYALAFDSD